MSSAHLAYNTPLVQCGPSSRRNALRRGGAAQPASPSFVRSNTARFTLGGVRLTRQNSRILRIETPNKQFTCRASRRSTVNTATQAPIEPTQPEPEKGWLWNTNIAINLSIVVGVIAYLAYIAFSDEHLYWRGWTLSEKVLRIGLDVWEFYLKNSLTHPWLVPMSITGLSYVIADWISQTYEGRNALDFSRFRLFRTGAIGFFLLGPLAHSYYSLQDLVFSALVHGNPTWTIPVKIAFDQSMYAALYNTVFYTALGLFRGDSISVVVNDIKSNFWRLMKAGWKLWPFVHIITYSFIPTSHKVLWVDCVEIIWAFILCTIANEKREENVEMITSAVEGQANMDLDVVEEKIQEFINEVQEEVWSEELKAEGEKQTLTEDYSTEVPDYSLIKAIEVERATQEQLSEIIQDAVTEAKEAEVDAVLEEVTTEEVEETVKEALKQPVQEEEVEAVPVANEKSKADETEGDRVQSMGDVETDDDLKSRINSSMDEILDVTSSEFDTKVQVAANLEGVLAQMKEGGEDGDEKDGQTEKDAADKPKIGDEP